MYETPHDEAVRLAAAIRESRTQRRIANAYCRQARFQLSFQAHHLVAAELAAATERARLLFKLQHPAKRSV